MWSDLITTFALVAPAELGDKSQLACLLLAQRHPKAAVLWGAAAAFAVLSALAVVVGDVAARLVDPAILQAIAGALLIGLGLSATLSAWREEAESVEDVGSARKGFVHTFGVLVLAEMGDKTQLVMAALAAEGTPWAVGVGGFSALWLNAAAVVFLGDRLLRRAPLRTVKVVAGAALAIVGLIMVVQATM